MSKLPVGDASQSQFFAVGQLATGWVEWGLSSEQLDQRAVVSRAGLVQASDSALVVSISLGDRGTPGRRIHYRVVAQPLRYESAYQLHRGEPVIGPTPCLVLPDPAAAQVRVAVVNDTHEHLATVEALAARIGAIQPEVLVWNGDTCAAAFNMPEELPRVLLQPGWAATRSLLFVPGNHDVRGACARKIRDCLAAGPDASLPYNVARRHGPLALLTLDTGEDKPDAHPVFAGTAAYEPYRLRQAAWLREALARPEIASAPFKVVFCHIPLRGLPKQNDGLSLKGFAAWSGVGARAWLPVLREARVPLIAGEVDVAAPACPSIWPHHVAWCPLHRVHLSAAMAGRDLSATIFRKDRIMRRKLQCALTAWLLASWLFPLFVQAQPVAGPSISTAAAKRNDWYWTSPVNIHWDNHGNPFGQGMSVDDIVKLFAGIKVDMIQVSARSAYTTYPSQVGVPNPKLAGYDTLATWREVTRRLSTRLWIYINVIDEPYLIDKHPNWQRVDARGNKSRVCNRPSADGSGYLEQMMIPMVREISERYRPDGFWFDGDWQIPPACYCGNCKAAWKQATGNAEPPKDAKDADWPRWARLEHERLDEYKQKLADAIHQADAHCCYTSNWSWAISQRDPRTAPDFADTLSGDVGAGSSQDALDASRFASLMLSAQEHTPHDVMSAIYPKPIRTLPRMLQEGGLVMSSGSSWFLWVNQLAPEQFAHLRTCYGLVDARREALGRTHSLNPVALLLSEASWEHGLTSSEPGYFDSGTPRNLAFALQDAHYGVDVVNEQTLREQISHWRMVVLANQRQISPATLVVLKQYVEQGGTLIVTDDSLRSGDEDSPETVELLGVSRTGWKNQRRQALDIGSQMVSVRVRWKVEPRGAEVMARLAGREEPVLTVRPLGKGRVAYLASAGFPYPDEDGMVQWLMKKLGLGPMIAVSGEARDRHLVCSLRRRERQQLVLHINDLTTFADGKRIEPNSSHQIDPVTPIPEIVLQLPLGTKPTAVKVVPTTTRLEWEHQNDMLRLVLHDFRQHAAVLLDTMVPERLQLLSPAASFPPPRTYETSPVILSEDFDDTPVGEFPAKPVWAANTDAKTAIHVAVDPVSPTNHVLEFVDAPDARAGFLPYLVIKPQRLDRGRAKFSCDCYLEPDARVNFELRDESSGSLVTGPSIRTTETGNVQAGGKALTAIPLRRWFHLELDFAMGSDAPTYDLAIVQPDKPPERFDKLLYVNPAFAQCTWLGVVSYATVKTHFYVDNLRLERLP